MGLRRLKCCGIREITDVSSLYNPKLTILKFIKAAIKGNEMSYLNGSYPKVPMAFAIFSSTNDHSYGPDLAAFITEHKLGELTKAPVTVNPNSLNRLHVWTWAINQPALQGWYLANKQELPASRQPKRPTVRQEPPTVPEGLEWVDGAANTF